MSSRVVDARVDTTMMLPPSAAPRAVATSPSGCATRWKATGATSTGDRTEVPRTVVATDTSVTSQRIRGRSRTRAQAATLSSRVRSSPAPPAR